MSDTSDDQIKVIIKLLANKEYMHSLDMQNLSKMQVSLAVLNAYLGEQVAIAEQAAKKAQAEFEFTREKIYAIQRENGKTTADADNFKRTGAEEERKEAIQADYVFKLKSNLRKDTMGIIEAVRSRLSLLKDERKLANESN